MLIISHCFFIFYQWFSHITFKNYFSITKITATTWSLTLSIFIDLGNGCFLFCLLGLNLLKLLKTMLILNAPYLACHLQNGLSQKKSFGGWKPFLLLLTCAIQAFFLSLFTGSFCILISPSTLVCLIILFGNHLWLSQFPTKHLLWSGIFTIRFS